MNLDELLRTAAHDVASHAMPDPPDLDAIRHRARRTRTIRVASVAASAAAVVAVAGLALQDNDQSASDPVTNTPTSPAETGGRPPTVLRYAPESPSVLTCCTPAEQPLRPGGDYLTQLTIPGSITAVGFVAPGKDWIHFGSWTNKGSDLRSTAEVLITDLESLPRDACDTTQGWREVSNPMAIATALADLEQMIVLQAPSQGEMLGYPAVHLRLQGPQRSEISSCNDGGLRLWRAFDEVIGSGHAHSGQLHDLWLVELDSAVVAIEQTWFPETPRATVQELRELVDSLYLEQE